MRSEMAAADDLWLVSCLNATLDPNLGARNQAEGALTEASRKTGYGIALARITLNNDFSLGVRQLAAVLLKHYVKKHWIGDDFTVFPQDKEMIRKLLPLGLGDPEKKIQTAVGMVIACIAISDWPEEWPELMMLILACINDRSDVNKVNGGMRCLYLFADEMDDRQLPHLVPVLFPALYDIISTSSVYAASTRKEALNVLHSCIATLGVMSGAYQSETKALMKPMLKGWLEQFAAVLLQTIRPKEPDSWLLKMEAIKALQQIVMNFSKLAFNDFTIVLSPLWHTFVTDLQVYVEAAVNGDEVDLADPKSSEESLESYANQLLEFLLCLVGHSRYCEVIRKSIKDLAYFTIGYMQMTEEQVQTWSGDASEFLAEEDTLSCSCRTSGVLLLQEFVGVYEDEGTLAILEAVSRRMEDADRAKSQGETGWWKVREAALLTLGSCVEADDELPGFSIDVLFNRILVDDLSQGMKLCPFLYGRALWAVAKFSSCISKDKQEKFFLTAIEGLSDTSYIPIMVASCQAVSTLLPKVESRSSQPYIRSLYTALATLLQQGSEETMHIVLDALQSAIKADKDHMPEAEAMLSPILLHVWATYIRDPLISIDALSAIEAVKNAPGCMEPLAARVLPAITGVLCQPRSQQEGQVAGALDLLTMLVKNAPLSILKHAHHALFTSIIDIVLQTNDDSELQNATECLAGFVKSAGENLLAWATDADSTMKMLLAAAGRLLNPQTNSSGSLYSGTFIVQLIEKFSLRMAPHLRDLVTALVVRLESVALKGSLIFVFAKLVHMSAPNYGQFIELLRSIPSKGYGDSLTCVMAEWTKCHDEVQGSYQIKVSTTALASLLATGHPLLSQVQVEGRLLEATGGIKTRSKSKLQPDQFTRVSALQKIFSLLARGLVEGQEAASNFVDEDDEWEELSNPDGNDVEDVVPANKSLRSVFEPADLYEDVLNGDVSDGDEPSDEVDPINQINLQAYLVDFMKRFSQEAPLAFSEFFKELSDREKCAVQDAVSSK
ncbi:importin-9 isoform X1 [Selaginella moellendorffii]|uniref:importin-9 isoform X1 n=1 Tax=Selaginella moellendorffii TaxID=88036 RepID=UPI000D1C7F12|nr:importin-9 isoform X1 [Selaginella moellendorffii]|eukprot:XP_024534620.1 importin-9 isoform X1 [Selaginella moellendorffii]